MNPRQSHSILVTDYDQCAFTSQGSHPNMISTGLLQHISSNKYDAFYGCTHRCYSMLPRLKVSAKNKNTGHYTDRQLDDNFPTYKITANIAYTTGLPCLAVSTLEDSTRAVCGNGFNDVISPFEIHGKVPDANSYIKFSDVGSYSKTKNLQLTQVALHAQSIYPNSAITLDYIDDNKTLCNKALTLTQEPTWPARVNLNIFHHAATEDNAPVKQLNKPSPRTFTPRGIIRRPTTYPQNGIFAQPGSLPKPPTDSHYTRNGKKY